MATMGSAGMANTSPIFMGSGFFFITVSLYSRVTSASFEDRCLSPCFWRGAVTTTTTKQVRQASRKPCPTRRIDFRDLSGTMVSNSIITDVAAAAMMAAAIKPIHIFLSSSIGMNGPTQVLTRIDDKVTKPQKRKLFNLIKSKHESRSDFGGS